MNGNLQKYQNTNRLQQYLLQRFLNKVGQMVADIPAQSVLDIGCAEGFVLNSLQEKYSHLQLTGIDVDQDAIARGRELFPRLHLQTGNGLQLDVPDNSYDLVLTLEIMEHLKQPELLLAEIRRVSKKHCLISVPHEPWFRLANLARGKNISRWGNDIEHINHWNPRSLPKLLRSNGFTIVEQQLPFPWMLYRCEV